MHTDLFQIPMALFYVYRFVYIYIYLYIIYIYLCHNLYSVAWLSSFVQLKFKRHDTKDQGIPHDHILQKSKEINMSVRTCRTHARTHTSMYR